MYAGSKKGGYMRRAGAEAKAMAIGNVVDVWRLNTVSPLQKENALWQICAA